MLIRILVRNKLVICFGVFLIMYPFFLALQGIDRCGQGGAAQQTQKCDEISIAEFV